MYHIDDDAIQKRTLRNCRKMSKKTWARGLAKGIGI